MVASLKGFIPGMARLLGITASALYERQRALVRGGQLDLVPGRGPGSGVRADFHSVALLLLAVLATDSLSETEDRVTELAQAKCSVSNIRVDDYQHGETYYPEDTFGEQLEFMLTHEGCVRVEEITISRTSRYARLVIALNMNRGELVTSKRFTLIYGEVETSPVEVLCRLDGQVFSELRSDIHALLHLDLMDESP